MMTWRSVRGSVVRFCSVLLIVWIVVLTLVVWVPHMGFVDFYLVFSLCNVDVVDFIFWLFILCLVMIRGSKFVAFSKAVCRFSGRSWLNLPVISSLSFPYNDDA